MPRKRMIDPAFFVSRTLNALPVTAMVTFAGFWCFADDYGRADDDAVMIAAEVWPRRPTMTVKKVRDDLDGLVSAGVLCQYEVNGYALLHVTAWSEHQKISHPAKSKLPPCSDHEPEGWAVFLTDDDAERAKFRDSSRAAPEALRRGSGGTPRQCSLDKNSSVKSKKARSEPDRSGGRDLGLVAHA